MNPQMKFLVLGLHFQEITALVPQDCKIGKNGPRDTTNNPHQNPWPIYKHKPNSKHNTNKNAQPSVILLTKSNLSSNSLLTTSTTLTSMPSTCYTPPPPQMLHRFTSSKKEVMGNPQQAGNPLQMGVKMDLKGCDSSRPILWLRFIQGGTSQKSTNPIQTLELVV